MVKVKYGKLSNELKNLTAPSDSSTTRSSLGLENHVTEICYINIEKLIPFSNQTRKIFNEEDIEALAETIKEHGIRNPLTVIKSNDDNNIFEVISGERRLRAAKKIGLIKLPCIIINDRKKGEEISIIENIHRTDLHPLELGECYKKLNESGLYKTQKELAEKISVKQATISEYIKYTEIPPFAYEYLLKNNICSRDILRKVIFLKDENKIREYLKINAHNSFSLKGKPIKSASIIRITLSEGNYKIQKKGMNLLSLKQKEELKKELFEIIKEL